MILNVTFHGIKVSNDCKYWMTAAVCKLPVTIYYTTSKDTYKNRSRVVPHCCTALAIPWCMRVEWRHSQWHMPLMGQLLTLDSCAGHYRAGLLNYTQGYNQKFSILTEKSPCRIGFGSGCTSQCVWPAQGAPSELAVSGQAVGSCRQTNVCMFMYQVFSVPRLVHSHCT